MAASDDIVEATCYRCGQTGWMSKDGLIDFEEEPILSGHIVVTLCQKCSDDYDELVRRKLPVN